MSKKSPFKHIESSLVRIVDETDREQDDFDLTIEIRPAKKSHVLIRILPEESADESETVISTDDELPF